MAVADSGGPGGQQLAYGLMVEDEDGFVPVQRRRPAPRGLTLGELPVQKKVAQRDRKREAHSRFAALGEESKENENNDSAFLEKILLDFGVNGTIKKVSHGPVVTLNEFEPAAGVKVSKIINLSDDIARNTSSESARIATIPGSNTIGIARTSSRN